MATNIRPPSGLNKRPASLPGGAPSKPVPKAPEGLFDEDEDDVAGVPADREVPPASGRFEDFGTDEGADQADEDTQDAPCGRNLGPDGSGTLFEDTERGVAIRQVGEELVISLPGRSAPIRLKTHVGKPQERGAYRTVTKGEVKKHKDLADALRYGHDLDGKNTYVNVHQIVAIIAHRATLVAPEGEAPPSVHHLNLDTLDNRACNLTVLTADHHTALHNALDAIRKEDEVAWAAIMATVGCAGSDPEGLGQLPEELRELIRGDREIFHDLLPIFLPGVGASLIEEAPLEEVDVKDKGEGQEVSEVAYDPHPDGVRLIDLSLDYFGDRMVVGGTIPKTVEKLDEDGEPVKDRWGRQVYEIAWVPHFLVDNGTWVRPDRKIPKDLQPYKTFELHGVDGETRWTERDMQRFQRGEPPMSDLFGAVANAIGAVVGFSRPVYCWLVAAYVALTYVFPLARRSPFLHLRSAMPASGKSTLLEVLSRLAFNAHRVGGSTTAVIPRLVNMARCTLLLDEAESLATSKGGASLIEILNARSDAGSPFLLTGSAKNNLKPELLDLFGPTVIANLGGLAPTLATRSLTIEMVPLTAEESERMVVSVAEAADWGGLRGELYLWARAHWREVKATHDRDPAVRVGGNRHADLWRLVLAVALHFAGQEVFEALKAEASSTAHAGRKDDIQDAMAFALWKLTAGTQTKRNVRLGSLLEMAHDLIEDDQKKFLHSRKLGGFCRNLRLEVERSTEGPTEVRIKDSAALRGVLKERFPHLFD
jgi:hypothetical protein